jgi:hypothetical protein
MDRNKIVKMHASKAHNAHKVLFPLISSFGSPLVLIVTIFVGGCASHSIYHWGDYEDLIYAQYHEPGKATPEYQIEKMQADIQRAKSENKPLPPGFYAHLGYQYLQLGKAAEARQCFETEKGNFPESAVLMDRFLKKLK